MKRKNRYSKVTNAMILEELRKIRQCRNAEEFIAFKKAERKARRIKKAKRVLAAIFWRNPIAFLFYYMFFQYLWFKLWGF